MQGNCTSTSSRAGFVFCQETFTLTGRGTISIQGDYNLQENIYDATAVRGSAEFDSITAAAPVAVSWELNDAETRQLYSLCLEAATMPTEAEPLPEESTPTARAQHVLSQPPGILAALACCVVMQVSLL